MMQCSSAVFDECRRWTEVDWAREEDERRRFIAGERNRNGDEVCLSLFGCLECDFNR